ncbi:MAG: tRNA lysidine(34) synthetase TilS [Paludibacter sp.]|nr:tRNA lysidine(34) synthetase TilS [Paludibacter sp.]
MIIFVKNLHFSYSRKMLEKVQKFIDENHLLINNNKPVIVGVSGGSDSVVLLDILHKSGYKCIIAHCNFHLRMEESERDNKFVLTLSSRYQLPVQTIDFKTIEHAEKNNISIEMAARELRYSWFEKLLVEHDAQAIAVGHHADDNIETILLNLSRGTGIKGLIGMPLRNGNVIRPLLSSSRREIKHYIKENRLIFVEDSTNASTDIIRNKIRHQLIPLMEEINPAFRSSMMQTRINLEGAYNIFQTEIKRLKNEIISLSDNKIRININTIKQHPDKETLLFEILKEYQFHPDQIIQISDSLNSTSGKLFFSSRYALLRDRNDLIIQPLDKTIMKSDPSFGHEPVTYLEIRTFQKEKNFEFSRNHQLVHLDADKVILPLTQRKWQAADYFFPLGMKRKKKISDFLIDEKIDRFEKENVQVLTSEGQIVWVIGLRMDDRYKVTDETQQIMEIVINDELSE